MHKNCAVPDCAYDKERRLPLEVGSAGQRSAVGLELELEY